METIDLKNEPAAPATPQPDSCWRELLLWCLPALLLGGVLRWLMMRGWAQGYYYGPDSSTYWHPVFRFFHGQHFTISAKRPWLYPVLMLLAPLGPKSPAFTAALLQHAIGLAAVLPLGALVRMTMPRWKLWIIPATLVFALHPQLAWWEHVLISDSLFTALAVTVAWAFCRFWHGRAWGWLALALVLAFLSMAVRPVGRALWLGMLPLLLLVPGLDWKRRLAAVAAAALLYLPASAVTEVNQAGSLLFASVFPLIDTTHQPHIEIKQELAPHIIEARGSLWNYVANDQRETWAWLESGNAPNIGPNYTQLVADRDRAAHVKHVLARDALVHHPMAYLGMIAMKVYAVIGSNTKAAASLDPKFYRFGQVKFLTTSLNKVDARFPSFLLGYPRATSGEGVAAAVDDELGGTGAQSCVLKAVPALTRVTSLYALPDNAMTVPAPRAAALLALFLAGICSLAFVRERRNFLPIVILGLAYLALTLVVGRAVERYRLPAEFFLIIMVFQGCDAVLRLARRLCPFCRAEKGRDATPS
jgi:hypothetical protein